MKKIIYGMVVQQFDDHTGKAIKQAFVPNGHIKLVDEESKDIKLSDLEIPFHPYNMERILCLREDGVLAATRVAHFIKESASEKATYHEHLEQGGDPRESVFYLAHVVLGDVSRFSNDVSTYIRDHYTNTSEFIDKSKKTIESLRTQLGNTQETIEHSGNN